MAKTCLWLIVQVFILVNITRVLSLNCFDNNDQFYCKLGTKMPYRFVANYNDSRLNYSGCTEKKIWSIIRHGTRFPGKKNIKEMGTVLPKIQKKIIDNFNLNKSKLPSELITRLKDWKVSVDNSHSKLLTSEGQNELVDLAERMQARFPTILSEQYKKELFKLKFTATQRTENSAKFYALGLFGQSDSSNISYPVPEEKDQILRFYKRCKRWRSEVKKNPETYKEKELFIQGNYFKNVLSEISKRVGFKVNYDIGSVIYTTCAFETAWNETVSSPWCDLLSYDDMKALEYVEDLKYYWVDGYGYQLNYDQACPALRDMFTFFETFDKPSVTAYFTHSGSILKMLSILKIAKDNQPLTHDSYIEHINSRKWRTSLIDAFGSNIAFVLYNCEKQGPSILVLHQERPVQLPGCPEGIPCPLSTLKALYPDTDEECQFDTMCSIK